MLCIMLEGIFARNILRNTVAKSVLRHWHGLNWVICLTPLLRFCSKIPTTAYLRQNPVSPSLVERLYLSSKNVKTFLSPISWAQCIIICKRFYRMRRLLYVKGMSKAGQYHSSRCWPHLFSCWRMSRQLQSCSTFLCENASVLRCQILQHFARRTSS